MDTKYLEYIEATANSVWQFMQLHPDEQKWLLPLLSEGQQRTIEMLQLMEDSPLTYAEIAIELGVNISSVKQRIRVLKSAGLPLNLSEKVSFASTGRPRKLIRRDQD